MIDMQSILIGLLNLRYILAALLLLGILVMIHEAGHFWAARLTGIEVMEFSIGFGPKLVSWKSRKHDTIFSIRPIIMGGFCAFYGEDDIDGKHKDDPRAYNRQSVWKRMLTVIMGPMMNFVLAFVVMVGFYLCIGVGVVDPVLMEIEQGSPAYEAGLKAGDVVTSVNGYNVLDGTTQTLSDRIRLYQQGDAPLRFGVVRDGETMEMDVTPFWDAEANRFRVGIMIGAKLRSEIRADGSEHYVTQRCGFGESLRNSWNQCVYAGGAILGALKNLVTTGEGLDQTSGPVGVVSLVSQEVRTGGFEAFLNLLVLISINLGVMNLLPIPGLDGSRFLFMVLEAIRRKPVPPEKEAAVHAVGMLFLLALMAFFTFKDVMRLFGR